MSRYIETDLKIKMLLRGIAIRGQRSGVRAQGKSSLMPNVQGSRFTDVCWGIRVYFLLISPATMSYDL